MPTVFIYIVKNVVGQYEDRSKNLIRAFRREAAALEYANKAETRAQELLDWRSAEGACWEDCAGEGVPENEYDPFMQIDAGMGGREIPSYHVETLELE